MFKITGEVNKALAEMDDGSCIDYEAPLSSLAKWSTKFENSLEIDEDFFEQIGPLITDTLSSPESLLTMVAGSFSGISNKLKDKYNGNQEFNSLIKLLNDVDATQNNKATKLIDDCGILRSQNNILEGASLVCQLDGLDSEKLARKVITIAPTLIEDCYKRYLTFLVSCRYALENSSKLPSDKLGVMQQQVTSLESHYPLLVHSNIAWIRNAMAHRNWQYDADNNRVKVFNNQGMKYNFSPDELFIEIVHPFNISSQLFFDACSYYKILKVKSALDKL